MKKKIQSRFTVLIQLQLFIIIFSTGSLAKAQNPLDLIPSLKCTLQGKVTHQDSGEPVMFATVSVYKEGVIITWTDTDFDGNFRFDSLLQGTYDVELSFLGFATERREKVDVALGKINILNVEMIEESEMLESIIVTQYKTPIVTRSKTTHGTIITADDIRSLPAKEVSDIKSRDRSTYYYIDGVRVNAETVGNHAPKKKKWFAKKKNKKEKQNKQANHHPQVNHHQAESEWSQEEYHQVKENIFHKVRDEALSTFSIDVDRASYSNVRRMINHQTKPSPGAVRIEEMINYFDYEYAGPEDDHPFAIHTDLQECPWNKNHDILRIALQGKRIDTKALPPSNLVFLIDVSGSMGSANKLPLVQQSFKLLVQNMRDIDRVAIVTYAGSDTVVLASTSATEKGKILDAIDRLRSGGGTAGAKGIVTAYKIAQKNFIKNGNNRVILATDGDFNIGVSSTDALEKMIVEKRTSGVFLSVLGFGMGNYKDYKMQTLANMGNGNHGYIDDIFEAKKVFIEEFGGTLFTIAKDVKIQIEFNPQHVKSYRLIGYENRLLNNEDFADDIKDAGELGAGHSVTALYEIIPKDVKSKFDKEIDPLKYQMLDLVKHAEMSKELATIKFRYKKPDKDKSELIEHIVSSKQKEQKMDANFSFCLAVAEFGLILKDSKFKSKANLKQVRKLAKAMKTGNDYKREFIRLVEKYEKIEDNETAESNE